MNDFVFALRTSRPHRSTPNGVNFGGYYRVTEAIKKYEESLQSQKALLSPAIWKERKKSNPKLTASKTKAASDGWRMARYLKLTASKTKAASDGWRMARYLLRFTEFIFQHKTQMVPVQYALQNFNNKSLFIQKKGNWFWMYVKENWKRNNKTPSLGLHLHWDFLEVFLKWITKTTTTKIHNTIMHSLNITEQLVIFGVKDYVVTDKVLDLMMLLAKYCIFRCGCLKIIPNFTFFFLNS